MEAVKNTEERKRAAGILMPIFSLPGRYGIGSLGKEAYRFADFLKEAGQSYWQILPVGPTGYGDSPYQSFSTFAGNPYFIDLELLTEEGLLTEEECDAVDFGTDPQHVPYDKLYFGRYPLLMKAFRRFEKKRETEKALGREYEQFLLDNAFWLSGYAEFMYQKSKLPVEFYYFLQFEFLKQWDRFKAYVNGCGIEIIGDIPIYVSADSSDVRTEPRLFQLDALGKPTQVAGCPPDSFAENGQLWGNPLYNWEYHKKTGYSWWMRRMKHCFRLYDIVRVDHFRGFDEYYAIPYGDSDARHGHWEKGPGIDFFRRLKEELGENKRIIAEDLGYVTDSVRQLVSDSGYPGMKILEFAFDSREEADYRPVTWPVNSVAYTGTHDNQTLKSWLLEISEKDREMAAEYLGTTVEELLSSDYVRRFIELTMTSRAATVIIPLQDYLGLEKYARINEPSTLGGNWTYRFQASDFTASLLEEVSGMTKESGRWRDRS